MNYIRLYKWSVLWGAAMLVLLLTPSDDLSGVGPTFPGFDKLAHCGTFFVLSTLLYRESLTKYKHRTRLWNTLGKVMSSTLIFAGLTELAQLYLSPSRTADWWDFFADAVGIGMSSFAFLLLFRKQYL